MSLEVRMMELSSEVLPADGRAIAEAGGRHLALSKPPGSLGLLEGVGARLAGEAGVILAEVIYDVPVLLDGVVSNAAALVAPSLAPDCVGHLSTEPGAKVALEKLGEGTGGLLAVPILQAARLLGEMATLEEPGFG